MDNLSFLSPGLCIAIIVAIIVIYFQISQFRKTKKTIKQLSSFFPQADAYTKKDTSITKDVLESKAQLDKFIKNPPARHIPTPKAVKTNDGDDQDFNAEDVVEDEIEYSDLSLIQAKGGSVAFDEVIYETNSYLCKNIGTSADFTILQDVCERKLEMIETQISNTINVPLYLGLAGTFIGIITGVIGVAFNTNDLFDSGEMEPLRNLLWGVGIAMVASFLGLLFMIINSAIHYKKAIANCEKNKNKYYDFIRRELMPTLSNSMASSLNSLKGVLGDFIGKFGHNLDAYANSAELLNDNIEKQHLLLVEVNKMKQKEVAVEIAETFSSIKESAESLNIFRTYQDQLNDTIQNVSSAIGEIQGIITSFKGFSSALNVVVENQGAATELQAQFRTAIEKHFPLGSDTREMYRKQYDELTSDAKIVSEELNNQLKLSTGYIKSFVEDNKSAFDSLANLNGVLNELIQYTDVQKTCYTDLKQEIANLKQEQVRSQQNAAQLNTDLLKAVKEMITAIKSMRN